MTARDRALVALNAADSEEAGHDKIAAIAREIRAAENAAVARARALLERVAVIHPAACDEPSCPFTAIRAYLRGDA